MIGKGSTTDDLETLETSETSDSSESTTQNLSEEQQQGFGKKTTKRHFKENDFINKIASVVVNRLTNDTNKKLIQGRGSVETIVDLNPAAAHIESQPSTSNAAVTSYDNIINKTDENDIYGKIRNRKKILRIKNKKKKLIFK